MSEGGEHLALMSGSEIVGVRHLVQGVIVHVQLVPQLMLMETEDLFDLCVVLLFHRILESSKRRK